LSEVVREMVGMLEIIVPKNASLALELQPGLPSVVADRGELQQVVMNLLTNAAEALGDEPGSVTIATSLRHLDAQAVASTFAGDELEPGDYVHLEVTDTGSGMSAEVRARLFDPFFTTKQSGRGLGMSAVLGIVRAHHGAIRVDSTSGRGTTFRLWFPSSAHPVSVPSVPPPAGPWRGSGTVLIADDEATIRSALATLLGEMGFSTKLAENGHQALELFDAAPQDIVLVLLDLTMPLMGGAETFSALRSRAPSLPVVMMSGYSEQQAFDRSSGQSRTAFLGKPYSVEALEAVVRTLLAESEASER
jgi:CheY-like chemotaxis protein